MHLRSLATISFLIFGLAGAAQVTPDRPYAVLPTAGWHAASMPFQQVDAGTYGSWHPSSSDIASLESGLSRISDLTAVNWRSSVRIEHPRSYFRQYIGVSNKRAPRIFINAFCDDAPPNWHNRLVIVMDGGTCFWQALYDPATKKFSDLTINGRA